MSIFQHADVIANVSFSLVCKCTPIVKMLYLDKQGLIDVIPGEKCFL